MHETLTIPGASGKNISIDLYTLADVERKPVVIFSHGFKGFKNWGTHHLVASAFLKEDLQFIKFNFSHNGIGTETEDVFSDLEGFQNNTFSKELEDLSRVITWALSGKHFTAPSEVFLIGHSLGGGISLISATEHPAVKKLATWASISSFKNLWSPNQEETWRKNGVFYFLNSRTNQQLPVKSSLLDDLDANGARLDILAAARIVSIPWLIIHGTEDISVPPKHAEELKRQNEKNRLLLIPDADHVFNASHPWNENYLPAPLRQVCEATIDFFKSTQS